MRIAPAAIVCGVIAFTSSALAEIKVWVGTTGNWTTNTNWSPSGRPNNGDDVFLTSGDTVNRTVTYNDTGQFLIVYRSVRLDSSGAGLMTLQQNDPNTDLHADFLYVGNASRGTYDLFAGRGVFGATEVHAQGILSVRPGAIVNTGSLLQTGGTVDSVASGLTVAGTYTFNGGSASGHVTVGTFLSNGGAYGGSVTALNRMVLGGNGNGTFAGLANHGPLTLPAGRTLALGSGFAQVGSTFTQLGNVSVGTSSSVNDGATWLHQGGTHVTESLSIARGGSATYAIGPGATLTAEGLDIALGGDGTFTQTGGVAAIDGNLIRGSLPDTPGRMYWNMSGGTMTHGGFFIVGVPDAPSGTFIQSGGFARVRSLNLNVNAATSAGAHVSGGTFIADMDSLSHGLIDITGGSVRFGEHLDGSGDVRVTGTGSLSVPRLRQFSLFVGGDGAVDLAPPGFNPNVGPPTHRLRELEFEQAGGTVRGRVDLGGGRLVVDYSGASPAPNIRQYLASGYAGGAWTGTGLMSAAANADGSGRFALGYAESADVLGATGGVWNGLGVDGSAVLVRFTRYGDANLDGTVNLQDFNRLASNFGGSSKGWAAGDFNYDGTVNLLDFNRLAAHFGLSAGPDGVVGPADWAALAAAIPEPHSLAAAGAALAAALAPRRRRRRMRR